MSLHIVAEHLSARQVTVQCRLKSQLALNFVYNTITSTLKECNLDVMSRSIFPGKMAPVARDMHGCRLRLVAQI